MTRIIKKLEFQQGELKLNSIEIIEQGDTNFVRLLEYDRSSNLHKWKVTEQSFIPFPKKELKIFAEFLLWYSK